MITISYHNHKGGINNLAAVQVRDNNMNVLKCFTSYNLEKAKKRAIKFLNNLNKNNV